MGWLAWQASFHRLATPLLRWYVLRERARQRGEGQGVTCECCKCAQGYSGQYCERREEPLALQRAACCTWRVAEWTDTGEGLHATASPGYTGPQL
ncbi:hypothetical protein NFI96_018523 [Prochilodus magdalenae]|nr:hypothetical protein NFI96_018523 [Prochilodus magdalenae]